MKIRKALYRAKVYFKYLYNSLIDNKNKKRIKPPIIKSIDETIDKIAADKCSVSRFGDGEFKLMQGHDLPFQNYSALLAARLMEIHKSREKNHLVCLPDVYKSLKAYRYAAKLYWTGFMIKYRAAWSSIMDKDKIYYNSFITRLYIDYKDKSRCNAWFNSLKRTWKGRDIVIIEGEKSMLGTGNDLFANAKSLERILAPSENAFLKYDEILSEAKKLPRHKLILIALGPTATVLAYDLYKEGYQAIDIGHVDIEYEWFLLRAAKKIKIENKYTNEAFQGSEVKELKNEKYLSEIIKIIQ
jgi:glycosyltransferase family protein